jgi:hypothetical protein
MNMMVKNMKIRMVIMNLGECLIIYLMVEMAMEMTLTLMVEMGQMAMTQMILLFLTQQDNHKEIDIRTPFGK